MLEANDLHKQYFDVNFSDKYNILLSNSASGKTYLRKLLEMYCYSNNISLFQIDYASNLKAVYASLESISEDENTVIFVDNGDIVLSRELELAIVKTKAKTKIFVIHNMFNISVLQYLKPGLYKLVTGNNGVCICSKRIGEL